MKPDDPESNPYANLGADATDRVPRPLTAIQFLGAILGFLIMGIGGILVVIKAIGKDSPWRVAFFIGMVLCVLGYALFRRTEPSLNDLPDIRDLQ